VATVCGLTAGFAAQAFCFALISAQAPGTRDYVVYWATGQQLAHHANPYDSVALLKREQSAGYPAANTMYMRNPPWTLPLVLPLGWVGARAGWVMWALLLLGCLVLSVHSLWLMLGRPRNRRVLLGYSFAPAVICLIYGQTTILALLGLVLFLRWHRSRPFLAGISLWLCALKPHLFLPFCVVLLAWIVVSRSYKILAGAATALAASCAIAFVIDPNAWAQYAQMVRVSRIEVDFIPCLSFLLRHWISPQSMWIQYLPAVLACAWAFIYFWPRRHGWDWEKDGSLVLLISILTAPYCWLFDQVLAIPALLAGAIRTRSWNMLATLAMASALVEIALFYDVLRSATVHIPAIHHWTYWTAPAWLAWYLVADSRVSGTEGVALTGQCLEVQPLVMDPGELVLPLGGS
jgi:hypothetical protein